MLLVLFMCLSLGDRGAGAGRRRRRRRAEPLAEPRGGLRAGRYHTKLSHHMMLYHVML